MKNMISLIMALLLLFYAVLSVSAEENKQMVDVLLFCGQSNMAGRGETSEAWPEGAPEILEGAGWEYRAMSKEENKLFKIEEPFGVNENKRSGISEPGAKTGSMVTAFVNAYYQNTGVPVIAISASKGGSSITQWQPKGNFLRDVFKRLSDCLTYLSEKTDFQVRHVYMVWCQGETDADEKMPLDEYREKLDAMLTAVLETKVEKLLMVRIGQANIPEDAHRYDGMIQLQTELAQQDERVVMLSCLLASLRDQGCMKDAFHYYQAGYNLVGTDAGAHAAEYVNTSLEPSMEDPFFGNTYEPNK